MRSIRSIPPCPPRFSNICRGLARNYGATGGKVGWLVAAPEVAAVLAKTHQFLTLTTPPMLQWAVAESLADDALIDAQVADWATTRAVPGDGLRAAPYLAPVPFETSGNAGGCARAVNLLA